MYPHVSAGMLLVVLACSLTLAVTGQQVEDDWIDPYDMLKYDPSTKTMRKATEVRRIVYVCSCFCMCMLLKKRILWPKKTTTKQQPSCPDRSEPMSQFLLCRLKACAYSPCSQKATRMCQLKDENIHGRPARRSRHCVTDKYSICGNRFVVKGLVFLWLTQSLEFVVLPDYKESRADSGSLNH